MLFQLCPAKLIQRGCCTLTIWAKRQSCLVWTLKEAMWHICLTHVIICMVPFTSVYALCMPQPMFCYIAFFLPKHKMHFIAILVWDFAGINYYYKWQKDIVMVLYSKLTDSGAMSWSNYNILALIFFLLVLLCFVSQMWDLDMKFNTFGNSGIPTY